MLQKLRFGLHPFHQECYKLALWSKCLKRRYGAVVVDPANGFSPSILGAYNNHSVQHDVCEVCLRLSIPSGTRLELCYAVHAEQGALINALAGGAQTDFCDVWVLGIDDADKPILLDEAFFTCSLCARMAIACGVQHIVVATKTGPVYIPAYDALEQSMQVARGERVA